MLLSSLCLEYWQEILYKILLTWDLAQPFTRVLIGAQYIIGAQYNQDPLLCGYTNSTKRATRNPQLNVILAGLYTNLSVKGWAKSQVLYQE